MGSNDAPPYVAIARLVDHVVRTMATDWSEKEERLGPIANNDHILSEAWAVQAWLDANLMTVWSQETLDKLEGRS